MPTDSFRFSNINIYSVNIDRLVQRSNRLKSFTAAVNGLWALPTLHFYYYKLVVTHLNYQAAQEWLFEDEYERVNGQILAEEVM